MEYYRYYFLTEDGAWHSMSHNRIAKRDLCLPLEGREIEKRGRGEEEQKTDVSGRRSLFIDTS